MTPGSSDPALDDVVAFIEPVLGTVLDLRLASRAGAAAIDAATARVLAEIDRLEAVFSVYDPESELCRWRRGEVAAPSTELVEVLRAAAEWFGAGNGAFNPGVRALMDLWRDAARIGAAPSAARRADAAATIAALPYAVHGATVTRTATADHVDLNAIAKGYIVERAAAAACVDERIARAVVNIGGDLRHRGQGSVLVGIEDPRHVFDNAPPLTVVEVRDEALATSGAGRRGVCIGDEWHGHVLDPRSGEPVRHTVSVSVIAPDAMTADALATIVGVLDPIEVRAFLGERPAIGALVIDADGARWCTDAWLVRERSA